MKWYYERLIALGLIAVLAATGLAVLLAAAMWLVILPAIGLVHLLDMLNY